jgi:hypothetical protein
MASAKTQVNFQRMVECILARKLRKALNMVAGTQILPL